MFFTDSHNFYLREESFVKCTDFEILALKFVKLYTRCILYSCYNTDSGQKLAVQTGIVAFVTAAVVRPNQLRTVCLLAMNSDFFLQSCQRFFLL